MKQPDDIEGYPRKLCKFIVGTATNLVMGIMQGQNPAAMADPIKLIVAMSLNCWDAAQGRQKIAERPTEERTKIIEKIMTQASGSMLVAFIDSGELGPKLGEILGNDEAGKNIAEEIKKAISKKIKGSDLPHWDPHEA